MAFGRRTTAGVVFVKDALVTRHISHYLVDRMTCHILPRGKQKGRPRFDRHAARISRNSIKEKSPGPVWRRQGPLGNDLHMNRYGQVPRRTIECLAPKSAGYPVGQETCLIFAFSAIW